MFFHSTASLFAGAVGANYTTEPIFTVDSAVVQMDYSAETIIVSTMSRCFIFYVQRKEGRPVGKQTRTGAFGACFDAHGTSILAARPKSRIWRADPATGDVLETLNFQKLLACDSSTVAGRGPGGAVPRENSDSQTLKLGRLVKMRVEERTMICSLAAESALVVLEPDRPAVVGWYADIHCDGEQEAVPLPLSLTSTADHDRTPEGDGASTVMAFSARRLTHHAGSFLSSL